MSQALAHGSRATLLGCGVVLFLSGSAVLVHGGPPPEFSFTVPDAALIYDPLDGTGALELGLLVAEDPDGPGYPTPTSGFTMSLLEDPTVLDVASVAVGPVLLALHGGIGPDFFAPAIYPDMGFSVQVIHDFLGLFAVEFPEPTVFLLVDYETTPGALVGDLVGTETPLEWTVLGQPPLYNRVQVEGIPFDVTTLVDGTITVIPGDLFSRGDCDGDGVFNGLADGLCVLAYQFAMGPTPPCLDAADADDDGAVNGLVDGILILSYQFSGGPPPAPPGPDFCGVDPTDDVLDCGSPSCP